MVEQLVMKGDLEQALITFQRETVKQPQEEIERIRSRPTWPSLLATIAVHQLIEALRLSFPNPTLVELEGQGHNAMDGGRQPLADAIIRFALPKP
jgi:hypothetical protein